MRLFLAAIAAITGLITACTPAPAPAPPPEAEPEPETTVPPAPNGEIVASDFEAWPFTVEGGELRCRKWNGQPAISFYDAQSETAIPLNGVAREQFTAMHPEMENFDTAGVWNGGDLTEVIAAGIALCSE